jgi:hypothetical protein
MQSQHRVRLLHNARVCSRFALLFQSGCSTFAFLHTAREAPSGRTAAKTPAGCPSFPSPMLIV